MNDLDEVRARIHGRRKMESGSINRGILLLVEVFYRGIMIFMVVCVLGLGLKINDKMHFVEINHIPFLTILNDIENSLELKGFGGSLNQKVNRKLLYTHVWGNCYKSDSNIVYAIDSGLLIKKKIKNNGKYYIQVKQDNGLVVTYENLIDVSVLNKERVQKNQCIGSYEGSLLLKIIKDGSMISYEEAISM